MKDFDYTQCQNSKDICECLIESINKSINTCYPLRHSNYTTPLISKLNEALVLAYVLKNKLADDEENKKVN